MIILMAVLSAAGFVIATRKAWWYANRYSTVTAILAHGGYVEPRHPEGSWVRSIFGERIALTIDDLAFVAPFDQQPTPARQSEYFNRLSYFPEIESLSISALPLERQHLEPLLECKNLQSINLRFATLGELPLDLLAQFRMLKYLDLESATITDAGLKSLSRSKSLERVSLDGTRITDDGLTALVRCPKLTWISLLDTPVTERGLEKLMAVKTLREVFVNGNPMVTSDVVERLRSKNPLVRIHYR